MGEKNGNSPQETRIVKAIERSRIAVCFVAMFLGHSDYFRTFAALTVFSLAGLTAVESLLFGDASARIKNWPVGTPLPCVEIKLQSVRLSSRSPTRTDLRESRSSTPSSCGGCYLDDIASMA